MKVLPKNVAIIIGSLALASIGTAPASTSTSHKFVIGDRIQTIRKAGVWAKPPTAGKYAGEQKPDSAGRIVGGPVRAADIWWWKVDFDARADGWTAQKNLRKTDAVGSAEAPAPVTPPRPASTASGVFNVSPASGTVVSTG